MNLKMKDAQNIIKIVCILAIFAFASMFALKANFFRIWLISVWLSVPFFIIAFRYIIKKVLIKTGYYQEPTVILGTGRNAMLTYLSLKSEPLMGLDVIAFFGSIYQSVKQTIKLIRISSCQNKR